MFKNSRCNKKGIRGRVLSLVLVLSVVLGMFTGLKFTSMHVAEAAEENIKYTIDSTTEVTYYPKRGPYGQIVYTKKHFTTGSGIKYYTRYFVISVGEISEGTDLLHLDSDTCTEPILVSEDGRAQSKEDGDNSGKDFYWYETSQPDSRGYLTTTYVLDGKVLYDLLGKASNNKKQGEIYIHHVFAVTGGSNSDSWHVDNHVTNNKEYWKYSDLLKLWWNNTEATHKSQKQCMNVPVPFTRNVRFVTAYYANKDSEPISASSSTVDFYSDKKMTVANVISPVIDPSKPIVDKNGKEYEIYKSSDMPFEWRWIKVPADCTDPTAVFADPVTASYNNSQNRVDGVNIKSKAATDNGASIPNGVLKKTVNPSFNLGDNVSTYTWVIILYVPVREKSKTTDVGIHFFDSKTKTELGSYRELVKNATMDSTYTVSNLTELLTSSGLDLYEIDTSCGLEFTSAGSSEEIKTSYASALDSKTGKGTLTAAKYVTAKLTNDSTTVAWIPVKAKPEEPKAIPVYVRYVTSDGSTISDLGKKGAILL